jgi:enterochelin esterase-like enzyme
MKNCKFLSIISMLLISKTLAECNDDHFSKFGYSCCKKETTAILTTDRDADWGVEDGKWCAINEYCWSLPQGYPCCKKTTNVTYRDETGNWGFEFGNWCGMVYGDMYEIAKEYMSKAKIVNPNLGHANDKAEGVTVEKKSYYSNITKGYRKLNVVLPPNYSTEKKYPVLYLLHGIYGDEDSMLNNGMGTLNVPANLAKENKAKEMIIVLPNEVALLPGTDPSITKNFSLEHLKVYDNFINELLNNIMPFIEYEYSVATGRDNTAIAGFSMGGRTALYIGYTRPDLFGYVAGFSPAWGLTPGGMDILPGVFPSDEDFKIQNPSEYTPYVTLISTGTADGVVEDYPASYHEILEKNQQNHIWIEIEGADHDESAVIVGLYNFVATLFGILN